MTELAFPLISIAVAAPLLGMVAAGFASGERQARFWAALFSGLSAAACLEILRESAVSGYVRLAEPGLAGWLFVDSLSAAPLALFSLVSLGVVATLSNRDSSKIGLRSILLIQASTLAAYAAANPLMFIAGWTLSCFGLRNDRLKARGTFDVRSPAIALATSTVCLIAGLGWVTASREGVSGLAMGWENFGASGSQAGWTGFILLLLAVAFRKGIFPFHSWVISAFEDGKLGAVALLVNGHLAAFLVARAVMPEFPHLSSESAPWITDIALLTALYAAVAAFAERSPRRILALLAVSQGSFVLAGLETVTAEGVSGALVYWMVVTVATTSLAVVLRAVEQRAGGSLSGEGFLGLAHAFPRLAAFFLAIGVALVGMPGTLGFCADELLLHGALASHPRLGLAMPIAAALNAFHLFRLFSRLFLGSPGPRIEEFVPDARLGERLALTAALVLLVVGGLAPAKAVGLRSAASDVIVALTSDHVASYGEPVSAASIDQPGTHGESD